MVGKQLRAMIVGIPNVGKSSLVNRLSKSKKSRVEDRPGVTMNKQWITTDLGFDLLDMPGVLWPKFDDQNDALLLALLGSINDDVLDKEGLVRFGLSYLKTIYPGKIAERYGVNEDGDHLLEAIAKEKLWLSSNGQIDIAKAVDLILKDIRSNKIGRITWQDAGE